MASTAFNFAGLASAYASRVGSLGLMTGYANVTAPAALSDMRRLKAIQTAPNPLPQPTRKIIKGDNVRQRTFLFQNDQDAAGAFEFGQSDLQFESDIITQLIYSLGDWRMVLRGSSSPIFRNMSILTHSDAASVDTGLPGFMNVLYPNVTLFPVGQDGQTYQGEGKFSYAATVNPFVEVPMGLDLMAASFGVSNGLEISWFSDYPTLFCAVIGDATADDFVVDGIPVSTAKTKAFVTASGVTTMATVSSINAGTQTITLSAAPANNALVILMYESSLLYE